jgi:hypothetical protein
MPVLSIVHKQGVGRLVLPQPQYTVLPQFILSLNVCDSVLDSVLQLTLRASILLNAFQFNLPE